MSEELDHLLELGRLDQDDPEWDTTGRLAGARRALARGVAREVIVAIYGENITRKAEGYEEDEGP